MVRIFQGDEWFNQDIGAWNVSTVEDMSWMFNNAIQFNQDIGGWDVYSAQDMSRMFNDASRFNQDIGAWNISTVVAMSSMLKGTSLSTPNYDTLLFGLVEAELATRSPFGRREFDLFSSRR